MNKKAIIKATTKHNFSFKQELAITIIDQLGPIIGGCLALAAALIERETMKEAKEDNE